jgi:hypothetical protein
VKVDSGCSSATAGEIRIGLSAFRPFGLSAFRPFGMGFVEHPKKKLDFGFPPMAESQDDVQIIKKIGPFAPKR